MSQSAFQGGGGGAVASKIVLSLSDSSQSSKYSSSNKLALGSKYFDPNDVSWGLSVTSTAKLYMLLETTNSANVVQGDLYRETGVSAPVIVASTPTTSNLTSTLVTVDVSTAFIPGAIAGVFTGRCWISTFNGNDQVTCRGAWLEIIP